MRGSFWGDKAVLELEVVVAQTLNVGIATEALTLKRFIARYVDFTSVEKGEEKHGHGFLTGAQIILFTAWETVGSDSTCKVAGLQLFSKGQPLSPESHLLGMPQGRLSLLQRRGWGIGMRLTYLNKEPEKPKEQQFRGGAQWAVPVVRTRACPSLGPSGAN